MSEFRIINREKGSFTGVKDVESFDEKEISLLVDDCILTVRGEGLHVTRLDLDQQEVDITGKVDSVSYCDGKLKIKAKEGLLKKLFQ